MHAESCHFEYVVHPLAHCYPVNVPCCCTPRKPKPELPNQKSVPDWFPITYFLTIARKKNILSHMNLKHMLPAALLLPFLASTASAVDVVLSGGVAVKSWEKLRGPNAHDNWWANFIRGATVRIDQLQKKNPSARIVWIVFKPAYVNRGREDGKNYLAMIREQAAKRKVKLIFVDTANQACAAINNAGKGSDKISSFFYFGHSNAYAFMLDYSSEIIGVSKHWIHEKDLATKLNPSAFAPNAECWSYGCYTGNSMSRVWRQSLGVPLWGNTESTQYQPVGWGELPKGNGSWVK